METTQPNPIVRTCKTCGNSYDKTFEVIMNDQSHYFDSFECAIHALAPQCAACDCRIIGHGVEFDGVMFCCANCSKVWGETGLKDRATARR